MSGQEKIVSLYRSTSPPLTTYYVTSYNENYVIFFFFFGTNIVPSTWKIENTK